MLCNKCKSDNPPDSEFCQYCGEKVIMPQELKNKKQRLKYMIVIIILGISLIISLGFNVYQNSLYTEAQKTIQEKIHRILDLKDDLRKLN